MSEAPSVADARLVSDAPTPGPPRPWHFPSFTRKRIGAGQLLAAHLPGRSLASVSYVFEAGATAEPAGRDGIATLLARALSEGTERVDAYGFAVESERLGAVWHANADWDSMRCGFEVPADRIHDAGRLLAEAARRPALTDAVLDRVRDERVDEIQLEMSQPRARAITAFIRAIFDDRSRYSRPDGGTEPAVALLRPDDVREFHASVLAARAPSAVVTGDLSDVDLDALAELLLGGWADASAGAHEVDVTPRPAARRIVLVDRPGSVQSMLYVGHASISRTVPDYVAATTMALVLGGLFNSRLNYRLREDKGYSYGAFGSFDTRRDGGVLAARSAVQTDVTAPALADVVREIEVLHDDGVRPQELEQAKSYRAGVFPISFAGAGAVASGLGDIVVYGHADDHFDRLRRDVQELELEPVNAAAATRLRPDELVCVVVGDASAVRDDLEATGIGPVEVVVDDG